MGQDFYRYVEGYNLFKIAGAETTLGPDETVTFSLDEGPGEVIGTTLYHFGGSVTNWDESYFYLTVDGVSLFSTYWRNFLGYYLSASWNLIYTSNVYIDSNESVQQFQIKIPYRSSCSLAWKNTTAQTIKINPIILYRVGR